MQLSLRTTVVLCAILIASGAQSAETIEWPAYGGAPGGGHYTTGDQITGDNVDRLEQAWVHRSGDYRGGPPADLDSQSYKDMAGRPTNFMATPIMWRDTLYYCTPFNRVFALDPVSGEEKWVFDPEIDAAAEPLTNCRGVSSWSAADAAAEACSHRIVTGTLDARLIAIDADTGERCAEFGNNGEVDLTEGLAGHGANEYGITSAPAIIGDLVVTGAFVIDSTRPDAPSGVVRAYSVRTGEFVWGWNPVHPERPARDADGNFVSGSTNVWSTISVDAERGLVIVPTGNSSPDYYGGDREGHLDFYSSSVVALDANTGEVVWHYQTVHHDIWDFDVPAQPTLVDLTIDGRTRPAVVQVTKMGLTFVLDRETGEPLFDIPEVPVPQTGAVEGEYLSPTQPIPNKPEPLHQLSISPDDAWGVTFWDEGVCREQLEASTYGPIYTPPSEQGTPFYPSNLGGNNWGAPAVDLDRRIMVTNTKHIPIMVKLTPREECPEGLQFPQNGSPYCVVMRPLMSPFGAPCTKPPWSTLAAIDLESGEKLWQVPLGTLEGILPWPLYHFFPGGIEMGGPMVTAGGLVFIAATTDAYIRAFEIETGKEIWKQKLPTSGNAVPMSYTMNGEQYVVIAAGGHFVSPQPSGDHLVAFRLKK